MHYLNKTKAGPTVGITDRVQDLLRSQQQDVPRLPTPATPGLPAPLPAACTPLHKHAPVFHL